MCDLAQLMLSERLHAHALAVMGAGLAAGVDVGVTVGTADEWLAAFLHDHDDQPDPEVVEWKQAVGLLPPKGG